jgi:hypothetical protein
MATDEPETAQHRHRIVEAHRELARVVKELDSIELHHAAAHVSTALDILRADHPDLLTRP